MNKSAISSYKSSFAPLTTYGAKIRTVAVTAAAMLGFSLLLSRLDMTMALGGVALLGFIALVLFLPEVGTMLVLFALYTNVAVVAFKFHGVSQLVAGSVSLFIALPAAVYLFLRREKLILDYPLLWMFAFLACTLLSSLIAKDADLALTKVLNFVLEGLALYFLIINVVRNHATLRQVIWVLLTAGSFLSMLTIYQEGTKSYKQQFGGLAQRNIEREDIDETSQAIKSSSAPPNKIRVAQRAAGPIGDPNRYAQILLVLMPLAIFRIRDEKAFLKRVFALIATLLLLSAILLTYSRGAFITIIILLLLMTAMRYIRLYQIITGIVALLLLVTIAFPNYFARIDTIRTAPNVLSADSRTQPDAPIRGRLTEMLAAFSAFLDHPIIGVGPGQYTPYYSIDYMNNPKIAFRRITVTRRAHTLYFELAAETGILGFGSFMIIVWLILTRLWRLRRRLAKGHPESANWAAAFLLSIVAYLGTAIFLQLSYQRYYWLLLALAGACIRILTLASLEKETTQEVNYKITVEKKAQKRLTQIDTEPAFS